MGQFGTPNFLTRNDTVIIHRKKPTPVVLKANGRNLLDSCHIWHFGYISYFFFSVYIPTVDGHLKTSNLNFRCLARSVASIVAASDTDNFVTRD
jgi:hypothetical protein